jgi:Leucine-rich repeat (LRR) protein
MRRLCMIDNGLKSIRNLQPLGFTLTSLTLCDQNITVMENLELPNLRELFLHRNNITRYCDT